ALIAIAAIARHQFDRQVFVLVWSVSWMYFVLCTLFTLNNADVSISDSGISRVIFGRICQSIRWGDIRLVRQYLLFSRADGKELRFLQIVPAKAPFYQFTLIRKMTISEKIDDFDALIGRLNEQLLQHSPRIEIKVNGQWQP